MTEYPFCVVELARLDNDLLQKPGITGPLSNDYVFQIAQVHRVHREYFFLKNKQTDRASVLTTILITYTSHRLLLLVLVPEGTILFNETLNTFYLWLYGIRHKGCGMYYPVCGMVHIKEPLLLIGKSSPCGGSGFPLSLSEWSFTICMTPYNRK